MFKEHCVIKIWQQETHWKNYYILKTCFRPCVQSKRKCLFKLLSVTDPWVSITTGRTLIPVFFIVKFSYKVLILANLLRFFCSYPQVDGWDCDVTYLTGLRNFIFFNRWIIIIIIVIKCYKCFYTSLSFLIDTVIIFFLFLGPVWMGGQKDEDSSLHSAMYNSLSECHSRLLSSVAVPAISSGIFGFPKARCAKILFSAVLEFFRAEPKSSVNLVRLTNFDKPTVEIFKDAAADLNEEPDIRVELGQASWNLVLFNTSTLNFKANHIYKLLTKVEINIHHFHRHFGE